MTSLWNRIRGKKKGEEEEIVVEAKPTVTLEHKEATRQKTVHRNMMQYIEFDDFEGGIAFVRNLLQQAWAADPESKQFELICWQAWFCFRAGRHDDAYSLYKGIIMEDKNAMKSNVPAKVYVWLRVCAFFMGNMKRAGEGSEPYSPLEIRMRMCRALKLKDDKAMLAAHKQLTTAIEDQLCLCSIHFQRGHFNQAREILDGLIAENPKFLALKYYLALCYYKMEYWTDAKNLVKEYLVDYGLSLAANNLLNCCNFRLGLPVLLDAAAFEDYYVGMDVIYKHNKVVFDKGLNAMQVLPALANLVPEAKLNMVIYNLNRGEVDAARTLAEQLNEETIHESMAEALITSIIGQRNLSKELVMSARKLFHDVSINDNVRDTIPGRQCGASYYFLSNDFESVVVYLNSIKGHCVENDNFFINLGQALVKTGRYEDAISCFAQIRGERTHLISQNLVRAYVLNMQPELAWDVFTKDQDTNEHPTLLLIIATDSSKTRQFASMARAFDYLERMDPHPDYWIGKRAAVAGQFQLLVQGKCTGKQMNEVLDYLELGTHSQIDFISNTIRNWAKKNKVKLSRRKMTVDEILRRAQLS